MPHSVLGLLSLLCLLAVVMGEALGVVAGSVPINPVTSGLDGAALIQLPRTRILNVDAIVLCLDQWLSPYLITLYSHIRDYVVG